MSGSLSGFCSFFLQNITKFNETPERSEVLHDGVKMTISAAIPARLPRRVAVGYTPWTRRVGPLGTSTHTHTEQNRTGPLQNLTHRLPAPATHWAKHLIWCNIQFRIGCNYLRQASNPKKAAGGEGLSWDVHKPPFSFFFFFFLSLFHKSRPHQHPQPENNTLQWGRIGRDWRVSADVGFVDH